MQTQHILDSTRFAVQAENLPILYEDDEDEEMGEANLHVIWIQILHCGLASHLAARPGYQVYANMNLYYRKGPLHPITKSRPFVSPDVMVVKPFATLPETIVSYTIGQEGPAPHLATEVLSERSAQQRDLKEKLVIYSGLGVSEYLLADPTGQSMQERLLLKRLQPDLTWTDEKDADGGVTSTLGCRVVIEADDKLRVVDAKTGWRYLRPGEGDQQVRELQAEVERLRKQMNQS